MTKARLRALATALPPHRVAQADVQAMAREVLRPRLADYDRLEPVFANAGVAWRHSCVPLDWFAAPRTWPERNAIYLDSALALLDEAARRALDTAGLTAFDIAAVVCVSSTGIATPSLDARLMARLDLPEDTQRLPIFGYGCGGGVLGLARAATLAEARPGRPVLFLVVELCTLSFRRDDPDKNSLVATALFGDGAAAAVVVADGGPGPVLAAWGERTWSDALDLMAWRVEPDGLAVEFAQGLPGFLRRRLRGAVADFLDGQGLGLDDLDGLVCHPGGPRILDALAAEFATCADGLGDAHDVLESYGNMSAVTVLFVLQRALAHGRRGRRLLTAMGPGFTAGFLLAEL